jgi:hypothetical protein
MVAEQRGSGKILLITPYFIGKGNITDAEFGGQFLQFTVAVANAIQTVLGMVGQD